MTSSVAAILRQLARAGSSKQFVQTAILPDWWGDDCANELTLLPDVELRVARFLNKPLSVIREGGLLAAPAYPEAKLRRTRGGAKDRLIPAVHAAAMVVAAAVRSLRADIADYDPVPADAMLWRRALNERDGAVTLQDLLEDLWHRGVPVVPIDVLPTPSFQGATFFVGDRPVIVVSHRHDEAGRVAFLVAHEAGHIARGDCVPDSPVADEDEEIPDNDATETGADLFATRVLAGNDEFPEVEGTDFRTLAKAADGLENGTGAEAGGIIFAWAARTGDYATATMAVKALYRHTGARSLLRRHLDHWVDLQAATDTDRGLLRCVSEDQPHDALAG